MQRREADHPDRRPGIEQAGGLWVMDQTDDLELVRQEVSAGRVKALEIHGVDLGELADLSLEYLVVVSTPAAADAVNQMTSLRGLSLDSWKGSLDLGALPDLVWFEAIDPDKGQLDGLWADGHKTLQRISVGRYRQKDLAGLAGVPSLTDLSISNSRSLASLDGIQHASGLKRLHLEACSPLADLGALAEVEALESIVIIDCNRVADVSPAAGLPNLKAFELDMGKLASTAVLAGSDCLEYVQLGGSKPPAGDVDALLESTSLRLISERRARWIRASADDGWEHIEDVYSAEPDALARAEALRQEANRVKIGSA